MPVCVKCRLAKSGVKLCADDLLCPQCFQDNERQLSEKKKQKSVSIAVAQDSLTTSAEITYKTRASKTRQSKEKNQPSENMITASTEVNVALSKLDSPSAESAQPIDQNYHAAYLPVPVSSVALTSVTAEDISAWREIAQEQQLTIDSLQRQLNFVLSFLGITDSNCAVTKTYTKDCSTSLGVSTVQSADPSHTSQSSGALYASSVNQGELKSQANQENLNAFQQVVLATVDAENRRKRARQANVVISGLPTSTQICDAELVQQLLSEELSIQSKIASCQRLGKPAPGKIQLLKVCTAGAKEAADVFAAAKRLRHSADNHIRKNVFINRDMTKSEAEAAYQARCRRRHRDGSWQQRHHQQSSQQLISDSKPTNDGVGKSQLSSDGQIDNFTTHEQASASTYTTYPAVPPQSISPPIPPQNIPAGRHN
jgi:hypothetical protein